MKQLRDVNSAARLLSISPWTVRSYIHDGKLKAVRIGRRVLIEETELERFVEEGKAGRCMTAPVGLPGGVL
jgi:excisionase family DNA binding protein